MAVAAPPHLLNFVLVGNVRSGTTVVQTAISERKDAICHGDLFHVDEKVRRRAHEKYFGPCQDPGRLPEWYVHGETNPWQYISREVFANPRNGEHSVGIRLLYPAIAKMELFTLFHEKYIEGDFCVVHVFRNPVVCYISLKQAELSGVWHLDAKSEQRFSPAPISLDDRELTQFCRDHLSLGQKIRAACPDALEINYRDLFYNLQPVMRKVWDFLELDDEDDEPARPTCRRLRNRWIRDRVLNWGLTYKAVPSDIRQLMDAEDLF